MKEKSPLMEDQGPSLPSNYVTFLQLKQRWLQKQQQSPKSDSQLTVKPKHDSGSKLPNDAVPVAGGRNRNRIVNQSNQLKPDVTVRDSGSKTPNDVVVHRGGGNRNRIANQSKPEVPVNDSGSETLNDVVSSRRNHRRGVNQQKPEVPVTDFGSETPNDAVSSQKHRRWGVNQSKPEVPVNDSGSETPNDVVSSRRNNRRGVNQQKPEVPVTDSGSEIPNDTVSSRKNRRQRKPEVPVNDSASKTLAEVAEKHPIVEKNEHDGDESNSKPSAKKNGYRGRNPRFVTEQNQIGGSTEPEPEPVQEKKQQSHAGRRNGTRSRNRNQEDREPKGKTASFAQNDSGGVVDEVVVAAVEEINVSDVNQGTNRRPSYGRFNGGSRNWGSKPPISIPVMKWVKKGETAPN